MRVAQEKVAAFHEKNGVPFNEKPALVDADLAARRVKFIRSETNELEKAIAAEDLCGVAQEIADVLYVTLGTAVTFGVDIQPIFDEVHRANMTRDLNVVREQRSTDGGFKGKDYTPPRVAELLVIQSTGLNDAVPVICEHRGRDTVDGHPIADGPLTAPKLR